MATFYTPKPKASNVKLASKAVELCIDAHDHAGNGLCLSTTPITVVADALIGEKCRVSFTKQSKKVSFAKTTKIIVSSDLRVAPFCEYYGQCGGCSLQHANAQHGLAIKRQALKDFVANKLGTYALSSEEHTWDSPVLSNIDYTGEASKTGYRRRVRLAVDARNKQKIKIGFRAHNSDKVIDIPNCAVASDAINKCLAGLRQTLVRLPSIHKVGHIVITEGEFALEVALSSREGLCKKSIVKLEELAIALNIEVRVKRKGLDDICLYADGNKPLTDNLASPSSHGSLIIEDVAGVKLAIQSSHFLQVNKAVNVGMIERANAWLAPNTTHTLYDFYCGAGNFALSLAKHVKHVNGFEGVNEMVKVARTNANNMNADNCHFSTADLASRQELKKLVFANDALVVLDPSREGAVELCEYLAKQRVQKILYVSCNPNSFVRDVRYLLPAYEMSKIAALDMFPYTKHIELMALFTLK